MSGRISGTGFCSRIEDLTHGRSSTTPIRYTIIDLGLDDEAFMRTLFEILKPGGRIMIYNIGPAPAPPGKPYIPWADGRCPFDQALLENAGFKVVSFDVDDGEIVRLMAKALKWDQGESPMDLENDLFAHYTVLEKPAQNR